MILSLLLMATDPNPFTKYGWPDGILEPGHRPCVEAWQPGNQEKTKLWILGYISGRNTSSNTLVGSESDGIWLVDAVRVRCTAYPDKHIFMIADEIYQKHSDDGL